MATLYTPHLTENSGDRHPRVPARNGLTIHVAAAVGCGPTALAAFDHALLGVGAANYNLVRLSSVIPPATHVVQHAAALPHPGGTWGDRLYTVYAAQSATVPGREAWAGVGWVRDATGRGLFVEHEGDDEAGVRTDIAASLGRAAARTPDRAGARPLQGCGSTLHGRAGVRSGVVRVRHRAVGREVAVVRYLLGSSLAFSVGGILMKVGHSFTRWTAGLGVAVCFLVGAALLTVAVSHGSLGTTYVIGLGLEAIMTFGVATLFFREEVTIRQLIGVLVAIAGLVLLG